MEDRFGLSPVWKALLDIHGEFERICKKHGLTYYVAFGTALGAVRHQGFIPWDDDFDVLMPREDYDKFMALPQSEFPDHLRLVNWHNTPEFTNVFAKIMDVRKDVVRSIEKSVGYAQNQGIFIDIFPLDGYYDDESRYDDWFKRFCHLRFLESCYPVIGSTRLKRCVRRMIVLWNRIKKNGVKNRVEITQRLDELSREVPYRTSILSGFVTNHTFIESKKHKTVVFGEPKYISFMNIRVPIANDYDSYLKVEYGDYLKLPPKDKQRPSHGRQSVAAWKFGPTNTKVF